MWKEGARYLERVKVPWALRSGPPEEGRSDKAFVFANVSDRAYAACAYLKNRAGGVKPLFGKSRVAPLHFIRNNKFTIPRLELKAAVLTVELAAHVLPAARIELERTCFFTDCVVVDQPGQTPFCIRGKSGATHSGCDEHWAVVLHTILLQPGGCRLPRSLFGKAVGASALMERTDLRPR